jgi:hypothetical protein
MLMYNDLHKEMDPRKSLLDFLESTYMAGAKLANWDIVGLKVPPLNKL